MMAVTYEKKIRGGARLCVNCPAHHHNLEMSNFGCDLGYMPHAFHRPDDCPIKPNSQRELVKLRGKHPSLEVTCLTGII